MVKSNFAKEQLKSLIDRVERLLEEKAALTSDITEVYDEASNSGFSPKIMRQVIRKRKQATSQREEDDALFDLYMDAVGFESTPLGHVALSENASE